MTFHDINSRRTCWFSRYIALCNFETGNEKWIQKLKFSSPYNPKLRQNIGHLTTDTADRFQQTPISTRVPMIFARS